MSGGPVWLYVPKDEVSEALAFGASFRPGDARMLMPNPIPTGLGEKHYARWRGQAAAATWLREQIAMVTDEAVSDGADSLNDLSGSDASRERVYLWVRRADAASLAETPGVSWDSRRQMFYATRDADLNVVRRWMTVSARQEWEAEQATMRLVGNTVRRQAEAEAGRRGTAGGERRGMHGRAEDTELGS